MIQCDECYLVVTKVAYCSDACKQKAYRKTKVADTTSSPIITTSHCKHGRMKGLCEHGCK